MMRFSTRMEVATDQDGHTNCPNILATGSATGNRPIAGISFVLFVAGAIAGLLQLSEPVPFGDGFEMVAIAKNLASHGSFANPFWVLDTGPTAANPPLYPIFLAILMRVLRFPAVVALMASVGNIVMNAITASLLPRISRLFFDDMMPGIVASILWLVSIRLMPAWDTSYTVAGLLAFCLCSASLTPEKRGSIADSVLAGIVAGLLFLLNPSVLMILVPWVVYLGLRHRLPLREGTILFMILMLIACGWMMRNHRELGAFVVRTNLGFTLYASNNDCARSSLLADESDSCYQSHHPNTSLREAQLLRSLGEVKFDRQRTADVGKWIKTHPSQFRELTIERLRDFWFPPLQEQFYASFAIWVTSALSIPGLVLMIYRRKPLTLFVMAVLLLYPLMYYVVVSDVRYRCPVLWLSLLPAGYFIQTLLPKKLRFSRVTPFISSIYSGTGIG